MDHVVWTEKYRPKTVNDCILPEGLKKTFNGYVKSGNIQNLLLSGGPGVGKTTIARALLEELGCDYIVINGSMDRNIGTLREDIFNFASTMSFIGGRKYVILDEADNLNPQSTQPAMRNFMEEFSANCGYILTCNHPNKIIDALHSRCTCINFDIGKKDKSKLAVQFLKRIKNILDIEHVTYDENVLVELITKHFPDWRRVLNELQRYAINGTIDTGIFVNLTENNFKNLAKYLKDKNFANVRKWVAENFDNDFVSVTRKLYDNAYNLVEPSSIPALILILADYQYKAAFAADGEVNLMAMLVEIMSDVEFK